jgi:subtilisin family serine protease
MPQYFVRFPSETMRPRAMTMLAADPERYRGFESASNEQILIADLSDDQRQAAESNGAKVYEDVQFYPTGLVPNPLQLPGRNWQYWERAVARPSDLALLVPAGAMWQTKTMTDVMAHINAPKAWAKGARGKGVTIGIVDTGVSSVMKEFPAARRSPFSKSFAYAAGPWTDDIGHGSMCAAAAAAGTADGGKYNGVAPDATILSARTNLLATDIYKLYDWVLAKKASGELTGPVVMSNSYGLYTCSPPPGLPADHPYRQIVLDAIAAGIVVVYAAGNNHAAGVCNHDPTKCSPNTIWGINSIDEVLSVGTVNASNRMDTGEHGNSSRGPGQWASAHKKPDCVAPTYGEVVWGSGYQVMEWWGTSGACPQVAGLAALLLSFDPALTPAQVADVIRATCRDINLPKTCAGAGLIDCEAAVDNIGAAPARRRPPAAPRAKPRRAKPQAARRKPRR